MAQLMIFARKMSSSVTGIRHVTVIGGGLMGSGIAQVAAQNGYNVTLVEMNKDLIEKAQAGIKKNLHRVAVKKFKDNQDEQSKFVSDSINRIQGSSDVETAVKVNCDLVIEAIVENIKIKHDLFAKLDAVAPEHVIFTSNTSSILIKDIASVTKRPERFGGLHFFNPVPVMKLLEVVRTDQTSEETYQKLMEFGKSIGKVCITCKDTPGFVVNRLLVPFLGEAVRMLERGDASARDIDIAMKLGSGHPMGPFELADYVGNDTTNSILQGWHAKFPENPLFKPIPLMEKMVKEGKFGIKSGEGFYNYKK